MGKIIPKPQLSRATVSNSNMFVNCVGPVDMAGLGIGVDLEMMRRRSVNSAAVESDFGDQGPETIKSGSAGPHPEASSLGQTQHSSEKHPGIHIGCQQFSNQGFCQSWGICR